MSESTKPEYMPKTAPQAVAWLVQRCAEVIYRAGKAQRFGPLKVDPRLKESGQEITNIQALTNSVTDLERAMYVYYNQLQGRVQSMAPPGLIERLSKAEEVLLLVREHAERGSELHTIASRYFVWLSAERKTQVDEGEGA